ncbi:hypothetical protein EDC39_11369 [Geothermobacter ehrlichii]|uniref:Uncharacterized protein n=1 Tax=Geothermobacter ehrlichii TaxID=213224 RepID=A0A5D3WFM9_9BACT|nr:MXAN_5187 C-terminal domain-containing protein [Geothermobacter ehrlichii]TYO96679.1 hypothetical protein EDC39_11369 [Geothermobacter ehrlichii]
MDERRKMLLQLDELEQEMRKLEIRYDQYFSGIEKREPMKQRDALARRIRQLTSRHVVQTDVRFRLQGLATRFHTYTNYWDRILRLMDEGKFERGTGRIPPPAPPRASQPETTSDPTERVYRELVSAYEQTGSGRIPTREQVQALLERQKEKIRQKFGDREIDFIVVTDGGKPKLKVRAKKAT